jgi:hypothetical protein
MLSNKSVGTEQIRSSAPVPVELTRLREELTRLRKEQTALQERLNRYEHLEKGNDGAGDVVTTAERGKGSVCSTLTATAELVFVGAWHSSDDPVYSRHGRVWCLNHRAVVAR